MHISIVSNPVSKVFAFIYCRFLREHMTTLKNQILFTISKIHILKKHDVFSGLDSDFDKVQTITSLSNGIQYPH